MILQSLSKGKVVVVSKKQLADDDLTVNKRANQQSNQTKSQKETASNLTLQDRENVSSI